MTVDREAVAATREENNAAEYLDLVVDTPAVGAAN
jgi:hypothetical protein